MSRDRRTTTTQTRPGPDADGPPAEERAPDSPAKLSKPSWGYVLKKTAREFSRDQCTDLAAALTYYAVLAMFPAIIALLSLVGLFGQGKQTATTLLGILKSVAPSAAGPLTGPITELASRPQSAGFAFVLGLLTALWSASGYVGAFGRAMNRMYSIQEGRPVWKLRPVLLLVTLIGLVLAALVAAALVLTGPAADAVGKAIGVGSTFVTVWDIAKWPVILAVVVLVVAILYYATPNVKQPKFRWLSVGALLAIVVWIVASVAFGFYVSHFGSYNKTYGSLAGVVVFLLWLWITNLALLFGAELDSELERGRELQAGVPAEETVQLPPRDTKASDKADKKLQKDIDQGRELRQSRGRTTDDD